jgi:hypothetical protein
VFSLSFTQALEDVEAIRESFYKVVDTFIDVAFAFSPGRLLLRSHRHVFKALLNTLRGRGSYDKGVGRILDCAIALLFRY